MADSINDKKDANMPHIGDMLGTINANLGVSGSYLASKLGLKNNTSISTYLRRPSLQAETIWNISLSLGYNMFRDLANAVDEHIPKRIDPKINALLLEKDKRIEDLEKELKIYKEIVGVWKK
jgi:hypothetical protein